MTYDVIRHVRELAPHEVGHHNLRAPGGQFRPTPERSYFEMRCSLCLRRRGLHRYGDEACMNPAWFPGSGRPSFNEGRFFQLELP